MARRPHLGLRRLEGELDRRKPPGFSVSPGREHAAHGARLISQVRGVVSASTQRPDVADDPVIFVRVSTEGYLAEDALRAMDMTILSQSPSGDAMVVYSPDPELSNFQARASAYAGPIPEGQRGPSYASTFNAIESVSLVSPADRVGPALQDAGFVAPSDFVGSELGYFDVDLWDPQDGLEEVRLDRLNQVVEDAGGTVLSSYRGAGIFVARILISIEGLQGVLSMREVSLVDLPPSIDVGIPDVSDLTIENIPEITPPAATASCIGVVDSGVTAAHPLLAPGLVGAFGVPSGLGTDDQRQHGTSVAGLAMYGSLAEQLASGQLVARFRLASAKVVNAAGQFDDNQTVPAVIDEAIRRLHAEFGCRIINISLGDVRRLVGGRPSSWAMLLDQLASELDIVITVSAGNIPPISARLAADGLAIYPSYMLEDGNRLYEPGSAVNALVVSSLAGSTGLAPDDADFADIIPLTEANDPSPFSRCGYGYQNCIKPDIAEYGGTAIWQGYSSTLTANRDSCGVLTLHENYTQRLFAYRHGTSFAAPVAAFKAAAIFEAFPNASANLVRALLGLSAEHPDRLVLTAAQTGKRSEFRYAGYGVAKLSNALESDDERPVMFVEDSLSIDRFAVYEVPIPPEFQTTKGRRRIRVSLAFDPPVRNSRKGYVGVKMGYHLARGVSEQDVFDRFRKWELSDREERGDPFDFELSSWQCKMEPPARMREVGTLQVGTFRANSNISRYGDRYFLVVRCEGKWAATLIEHQRFAVAVELAHEADLPLYQRVAVAVTA